MSDIEERGTSARSGRRPLGAFGEDVSEIGFGLGALARSGPGAPWEVTLDAALAAGIDCIDAAQGRFRRASELQLGELLGSRRDGVFLSTRCSPLDGAPFDPSAAGVRAQLEESLRALQTDRIDLYHVHDVESTSERRLLEETLPALVAARERGEVRYVGASGNDLEVLRAIVHEFPVDAVLTYGRLDLVDSSAADGLLAAAAAQGIAVVNAAPLHMGVLARPEVTERGREENEPVALAAGLAFERAEALGLDLPHVALRFAAAFEGVATTIVGLGNPAEVEAALRAFAAPLDAAERRFAAEVRELF